MWRLGERYLCPSCDRVASRVTVISGNSQTGEPMKTGLGDKQLLVTEAPSLCAVSCVGHGLVL